MNRLQTYMSYVDIPDLGRTLHPTAIANSSYLVSLPGTALRVREVPQATGGIRFAVDQKLNGDAIAFSPGGLYGNDVILYGTIGTASDSSASKDLYDFFTAPFRQRFDKVREFLVGPEAIQLCKAGMRLTIGASAPPEFDLKT